MRVFVTGGSRGIGAAIVNLFKKEGHDVISPSRKELDLLKPITLNEVNFDIIINNAGVNVLSNFLTLCEQTTMQVNYFAPLSIIQQCLPYMITQNYGRIINIGSIWIDKAKPKRHSYAASKNALHALTKTIAAEYSQFNILANTVSPGFILTDLTKQNNSTEQLEQIINEIPVKRFGQPEEIAKTIYHLTVENTFITGQNIVIDGGYSCTAQ